ncbi:protein CTLA-2-alpha-like [Episyrphus balteatus]|uniref:protein CTLA-2-alpha-like n=1 Tax=Episyrphus balteatus TaxID=286459 RepID=UPI0024856F69|nr:protein CTLA-2-alpha-like [Episyrphus balteatus]
MKFTLALLVVAAILGCVLSCSDKDFAEFKQKFNKNYASREEDGNRKKIFCKNLKKIEAHNELYKKGLTTYTQGVNQFSDLTQEEFQNSGYVMRPGFGRN